MVLDIIGEQGVGDLEIPSDLGIEVEREDDLVVDIEPDLDLDLLDDDKLNEFPDIELEWGLSIGLVEVEEPDEHVLFFGLWWGIVKSDELTVFEMGVRFKLVIVVIVARLELCKGVGSEIDIGNPIEILLLLLLIIFSLLPLFDDEAEEIEEDKEGDLGW